MGADVKIRVATLNDLPDIMRVFESAKKYMRLSGNFLQWNNNYPEERHVIEDMDCASCFVVTDVNKRIIATFAFILGEDPTYRVIDGAWLNNDAYGTIHRIASDGTLRGIFSRVCDYCFGFTSNIRIDTHNDNRPMLKALEDNSFIRCGTIICRDGTPRIAFHRSVQNFH